MRHIARHAVAIGALWAAAFAAERAVAQGFELLSDSGEGYAQVDPIRAWDFPADHGPHPGFRIEWWYVTASLETPDGAPLGAQWTLFRQALGPEPQRSGWESQQFWMAHAGVTTADAHHHREIFARGGIGQAGAALRALEAPRPAAASSAPAPFPGAPFAAWIDDWALVSTAAIGADPYDRLRMTARAPDFSYTLELDAGGRPLALQGEGGVSQKSWDGQVSRYYTQPFYRVTGEVEIDGVPTPVTGRAWLDREWSSQFLSPEQTGWDWFSLHLATGEKVMLFRLRHQDGRDYLTGNWISADGAENTRLPPGALTMTPTAQTRIGERLVPTSWTLSVPSKGLDVAVTPLNPKAWMGETFAYWEGPIFISGSHEGRGYLEMTGY